MKCFHLNDPMFQIPVKCGKFHHPSTKKFWGHVVTNKACRSNEKFAWLFDPDGLRINNLSHAMFSKINAQGLEHEYVTYVTERQLNEFIDKIENLTPFQAKRLFKCLIGQSPYIRYDSNYMSVLPPHNERYCVYLDD